MYLCVCESLGVCVCVYLADDERQQVFGNFDLIPSWILKAGRLSFLFEGPGQ